MFARFNGDELYVKKQMSACVTDIFFRLLNRISRKTLGQVRTGVHDLPPIFMFCFPCHSLSVASVLLDSKSILVLENELNQSDEAASFSNLRPSKQKDSVVLHMVEDLHGLHITKTSCEQHSVPH